ncbi:MAG: hypothetical protein WC596_04405 [Candidatus Shapirobacteria bacterium]
MDPKPIDPIGWTLIGILFLLLTYAGYLSYKSIDFQILQKLESIPLVLPTPIIASPSATLATPAAVKN